MLEAYKTITVPISVAEEEFEIQVPFTVELLRRVEDTAREISERHWFVLKKSDKSIVESFTNFCRPYFPEDFDFDKVQPTFTAFFFQRVRNELHSSIEHWAKQMTRINASTEAMEESKPQKVDVPPPPTSSSVSSLKKTKRSQKPSSSTATSS